MTTILIVEDNELNRDMLSRRLERKDYAIESVADGKTAIEAIAKNRPDLVLMDMNLPVLNGWDTCKQLRAQEATQDLPIIALTAHAMSGDEQKALAAGCNDYTTKPVSYTHLTLPTSPKV